MSIPNSKFPECPSLEHLKKLAKSRLLELRRNDSEEKLTTLQLEVAREYGFPSRRALKAQLDNQRGKKVASPVMRFLPVAKLNRSPAFYRDGGRHLGRVTLREHYDATPVTSPGAERFFRNRVESHFCRGG
jgi:hypothetical protein